MKRHFRFYMGFPAIFCLLLCGLFFACPKSKTGTDWPSTLDARIEKAGENEIVLVLEGIGKWYVNTRYPGINAAPDIGSLSGSSSWLVEGSNVVYDGREGEDKAKRALLRLDPEFFVADTEEGGIKAAYRAVVCTDDICSPPFTAEIILDSGERKKE